MKPSILIAVAAAGALSASATACPVRGIGSAAVVASKPTARTLLTSPRTCTPRMYWFPAECTSDRSVTAAEKARHSATTAHATEAGAQTCLPRSYWFPPHCQ